MAVLHRLWPPNRLISAEFAGTATAERAVPSALRVLVLACLAGVLACSPTPQDPQVTIRLTAPARSILSTAEPLQLTGEVQGTPDTQVVWSGAGLSSTGLFESAVAGTFTLLAWPHADPAQVASTTLRVVERPRIQLFEASPAAITAGETAQLRWLVEGNGSVLLDGAPQTGTSLSVTPAATTTFALAVTNEAGLTIGSSVTERDAGAGDRPLLRRPPEAHLGRGRGPQLGDA